MVEGTGLENRHTGEPGIVSSNLTLSVGIWWGMGAAAAEEPVAPHLFAERRWSLVGFEVATGWVAEWFKAQAWKACVRQNRTVGSNPTPSVLHDCLARVKRCSIEAVVVPELNQ